MPNVQRAEITMNKKTPKTNRYYSNKGCKLTVYNLLKHYLNSLKCKFLLGKLDLLLQQPKAPNLPQNTEGQKGMYVTVYFSWIHAKIFTAFRRPKRVHSFSISKLPRQTFCTKIGKFVFTDQLENCRAST